MSTTTAILNQDVFFIKHISAINPRAKVPLNGVEWTETLNDKGSTVRSDEQIYEQGVFPESKQGLRFPYSISNGYTFDEDIIQPDKKVPLREALNELVEKCGFTYIKGKNVGEVIKESNPRTMEDPFFSHPDLTLYLEEFGYAYDMAREPKYRILYAMMKRDPRFLVLEEHDQIPGLDEIDPRVEFLVSRSSVKEGMELQIGDSLMKVMGRLEKASRQDLLIIAMLWGIPVDDQVSEKTLKSQMAFRITQKGKVPNQNISYLESFEQLIAMKGEKLNIKYLIKVGVQKNIIRQSTVGFTFNNNPMGLNLEQVEAFLNKPDNSLIKGALELACNDKQEES